MTTLSPSSSSPVPRQLRLLIVDDRLDVLQDLKLLLELSGDMKITGEARNGFEAIHLAKDLLPDVVLMDLEMPGLDGYEATRRIKSQQPAPRVVILSVHASSSEKELARASGADDFVAKGSSYETLRNAILGTGESFTSPTLPG